MLIGLLGVLVLVSCYLAKRLSDEKPRTLRFAIGSPGSNGSSRGAVPQWALESAPRATRR